MTVEAAGVALAFVALIAVGVTLADWWATP